MAWVVDTSVLLDIRLADPRFAAASAACLQTYANDGLFLCPVSYIELAPSFGGDRRLQDRFLRETGVYWREPWRWEDTSAAHHLWVDHIARKRAGLAGKRLLADLLIEAFALRFQGLITRNPKDFPTAHTVIP